jgi:hypothetical protein
MKRRKANLITSAFDALSSAAKEAFWQEVDGISPLQPGRPLTAEQRALHRRARRRKPGRPKVGQGAEKVRISLERSLLRRTDALAAKHELTRSQLIATALQRLIAEAA